LNLNPAEQTNLTKLSLSKIVNNLKTKLKESEAKNQSISLKLDQALKQKEIYKSRCDELKSQQKNAAVQPRSKVYQGVGAKLTAHESQNSTSPFGLHLRQTEGGESPTRSNRSSGMSFQDRQRQKRELEQQRRAAQASSKPVESLADRRKKRQNHLIDPDSVDQLGSDLDKLKQNAESMGRSQKSKGAADGSVGAGELEDIPEEEMQFDEEREQPGRMNGNLTTIKEDDGEEAAYAPAGATSTSMLVPGGKAREDDLVFKPDDSKNSINGLNTTPSIEPDGNFQHSQFMSDRKAEQESVALNEEWVQEHFLTLPLDDPGSKLVDFFFLNTKIMCIFEDFKVCEIQISSKAVVKTYNL